MTSDAVAGCLIGLGYAALALGELDVARQCFEEGGGHRPPVPALNGLARVALREGRPAEALPLVRQALRRPGRAAAATANALHCLADALLRTGEPTQAAEIDGFLLGWRGTPHHVREGAKQLLKELEAILSAADLAAALGRGRGGNPDEITARFTNEA